MGLPETLARALLRLNGAQILELVEHLTAGREIALNLSAPPEGYVLVPRKLSDAMIQQMNHYSWTESTARMRCQGLWTAAIAVAEQEKNDGR